MATPHRLVERSHRSACCQPGRSLHRRHLRAWRALAPATVATLGARSVDGLRQGPGGHCRGKNHQRCALHNSPRRVRATGPIACGQCGRRAAGPGVSSPQIDNPARGFSFRQDGPLDMRMDTSRGQSVAEWLAEASIATMTEVIREYGEERFAGQIAKAIDRRRQERGPLGTTAELAEVVAGAVKTREPGKDPATRTFQAFRIFINAELEELQQALEASLKVLQPGGRLVVISFHSLEDRIVKQF